MVWVCINVTCDRASRRLSAMRRFYGWISEFVHPTYNCFIHSLSSSSWIERIGYAFSYRNRRWPELSTCFQLFILTQNSVKSIWKFCFQMKQGVHMVCLCTRCDECSQMNSDCHWPNENHVKAEFIRKPNTLNLSLPSCPSLPHK